MSFQIEPDNIDKQIKSQEEVYYVEEEEELKNQCYSYSFKPIDFIIPSKNIRDQLCISYDKTELFLVSCVRLFLTYYLFQRIFYSYRRDHPFTKVYVISLLYLLLNVALVGYIVNKETVYSSPEMIQKIENNSEEEQQ